MSRDIYSSRAMHDYMDLGGRAKQEARAEEQLPRTWGPEATSIHDCMDAEGTIPGK